ncbi:RTA1 like protein [Sarocladium implicatum]|nr:RTA1 like protein [Sarocladium implicatum]
MSDSYNTYYEYRPSTVAAALFAALFGISTAWHAVQLTRAQTWFFLPFLIGGIFETVGYVARTISAKIDGDEAIKDTFIAQTIVILLAPALFAASLYMFFGRLVRHIDGENHVPLRSNWITKIFVAGDVISFMTQGAGGGILGSADGDAKKNDLGSNLVVAGLFVQITVFGLFIVIMGIFHWRMTRCPSTKARETNVPWLRYIYILYVASGLILIRSVFRTAEYLEGRGGHLQTHEVYFYVLDTVFMFLVMAVFNVAHPSAVVDKRAKSIDLKSVEAQESGRST